MMREEGAGDPAEGHSTRNCRGRFELALHLMKSFSTKAFKNKAVEGGVSRFLVSKQSLTFHELAHFKANLPQNKTGKYESQ